MRVRSLLLAACMVVVPLLAMFSHHVPPEVAATIRTTLWEPLAAWAGWPTTATRKPAPRGAEPSPADRGSEVAVAAPASPEPEVPPAAPADFAFSRDRETAGHADRRTLEDWLARMGATAIDCQPLQGGSGMLLASCRVGVDPAGQLQRVFQATGPDPATAFARLVAEVEAWRQRTASRRPVGPGS